MDKNVRIYPHMLPRLTNISVFSVACRGRNRKIWRECVKDDMNVLCLQPEWGVFTDMWRYFIWANVQP